MVTTARAVTASTLGAWLLKASGDATAVDELLASGCADVTERCVRRSYRTDLIAPGQPVLLWISGSSRTHPSGLYAQGRTTGATVGQDDTSGRRLVVPVTFRPLAEPVLRTDLLRHPTLSQLEVLVMPAGSNPSYVSRTHLAELRWGWPQVTVS